jgi:hypothetical protein
VVGQRGVAVADGRHVPARRPRPALAPPHDRPDVGTGLQLPEDGEELLVHLVVERVVLAGVVVGDGGDGAVDVEPHPVGHGRDRI